MTHRFDVAIDELVVDGFPGAETMTPESLAAELGALLAADEPPPASDAPAAAAAAAIAQALPGADR